MSVSTFGQFDEEECAALWAIQSVSGVGDKRAHSLIQEFGSPLEVLTAPRDELTSFHYLSKSNVETLRSAHGDLVQYREPFRQCEQSNIWVRTVVDSDYPDSLREYHAPLFVFGRGDPRLLRERSISFSGSRDANEAAQEWVTNVAGELTDNYVIVSGGAKGIDQAAHRGALKANGQTVVVSATGHKNPYPPEHAQLFEDIVNQDGAVISHRPPDATATRHAFLDRNETNSALSPAIVIGAADTESGSMAQYRDAKDQGRNVVVPESNLNPSPSKGLGQIVTDGYSDVFQVSSASEIREILINDERSIDTNSGKHSQSSIEDF